jgi:signal transduction histidine kinase
MNKYISIEERIENGKFGFEIDEDISFDELVKLTENRLYMTEITEDIDVHLEKLKERLDSEQDNELIVWGDITNDDKISESEKIAILIGAYSTLSDMGEILTVYQAVDISLVNICLTINDEEVFKVPTKSTMMNYTNEKFNEINSIVPVIDKYGNKIGELVVSLHTEFLVLLVFPITVLFLMIAIMTFIIVRILLLPFIYKFLKPIGVLNRKLKNIAEYDQIENCNIMIEQKRPPTEIKELIDYSNTIIGKLQTSYHSLENTNDEIEAQKDELEAQNHELDAQKDELEAQKDELEAQNNELVESQQKLKSAQAQLVQSEKMASMGQLTAAIMHEINTPMGAVQSNNQMIDMMLGRLKKSIEDQDCESALKVADKMSKSNGISVDAANRVNEIIRNLKNFSRIDQAEFQKSDITEGFKSVLVLTSNLWKNKIKMHEEYAALPMINCFPSMINQVFMNIIVNAVQASDKNGNIYIKTSFDESNIYVTIKDDGIGIDENNLPHLFDNGFTTKPKDEGTGLGLSISKEIVEKHNGNIEVFNNEEKGATFKVTLPMEQNY